MTPARRMIAGPKAAPQPGGRDGERERPPKVRDAEPDIVLARDRQGDHRRRGQEDPPDRVARFARRDRAPTPPREATIAAKSAGTKAGVSGQAPTASPTPITRARSRPNTAQTSQARHRRRRPSSGRAVMGRVPGLVARRQARSGRTRPGRSERRGSYPRPSRRGSRSRRRTPTTNASLRSARIRRQRTRGAQAHDRPQESSMAFIRTSSSRIVRISLRQPSRL